MPEAHLGLIAAGLVMNRVWPRPIASAAWVRRVGWPLIGLGAAVVAWATRSVEDIDLERPTRLVTSGPYAVSRHPMYVAWTAIYVGVALVLNAARPLMLLPLLAVLTQRETQREEDRLREAFGSDYEAYRARVRRYL